MAFTPVRVLLAEDHGVIREGLRLLLERDGSCEVVAQAASGDDVLRYVRGHRPDLVVLDLNMPGRDSLDLIPDIVASSPGTQVVVLTMQPDPAFAGAALRAGASGYVLKEAAHDELLRAIGAVRDGRTYVDPAVGARLASGSGQTSPSLDGLTPREREVLEHLALGETNGEVAAALVISIRTVETHRANIQQKTGCGSRSQLVRYALAHGILR